jgi:hypothetical protein
MLTVLQERMERTMLDAIKLLTYTIYAFVVLCFALVLLVGYDFTHGG